MDNATGDVHVTLIQAPPATFGEILREGLGYLSLGLTAVQTGGTAACVVTAGGGCGVALVAGPVNIGVGAEMTALDCSDGPSTQCAWTAGTTVLSAGTTVGATAARSALVRAGLFEGAAQQMYGYGVFSGEVANALFSVAGLGVFEYRDDVNGVSVVTVRV